MTKDACKKHILGTCPYLNEDHVRLIKSLGKMEKWFSDTYNKLKMQKEKCQDEGIEEIIQSHITGLENSWVQFEYMLTDLGIPDQQIKGWRENYQTQQKQHSNMYYDTDIGRFISLFCTREMDSINFDCVQVRVSKKQIRIIEAKKPNEKLTKSEKRVFGIFKNITDHSTFKTYKVEYVVIKGVYPFQTAEVYEIGSNKPKLYDQKKLIKFLNFEEN